MKKSIIGNTYYTFSYNKDCPILKTYTITEEVDIYPDSPLRYYHTKEGYSQFDTDNHHMKEDEKFTFCDKYINNGSYDTIYGALNQIISWKNYYKDKNDIKELNRLKKIYNSDIFQYHLEQNPAVLI